MSYLDRAIQDGYAAITGPENRQKITYISSDNHSENYADPEEKVRAEFWAELIYAYDYPANRIKVEVTIPDRVPTDRADIVVFSDDECKKPYIVVECKRDGVTDAEFLQAVEQGVGNMRWTTSGVKLNASYVMIIAGTTRRVLDFTDAETGIFERENNIIADLPKAYGKPQEFRFYKGGVRKDEDGQTKPAEDIQAVSRETLISTIKKCHNTLWGGGRLSPPTAFGELCKLIFVKISDEQKPRRKGEPYQFQVKSHEPASKLADRINALYNEQKVRDPEVFTDSIKVDDRILRTVVSHLESINLNKTDLDVKGVAFEQFMDGFFKGDFGQYFTPRPIIEFAVKMMKPEHDWDVLDPACGSGGFLLHALDYMRSQAGDFYDKGSVEYYNYWHDFAAKHLYGIEINDEIARVAKMNMIVHDDGHTNVISFDALDSIDKMHDHNLKFGKNKFDLILTNPPFGATINKAEKPYLSNYILGKTKDAKGKEKDRPRQSSEILFIERIWEFLKPGVGKAAVVLPDGILTNSSSQYVRDFILEKFQLLAVVSLPQHAFAHFGAGVKASIIFVRKRAANEQPDENEAIFMAAPELIGYDATGRETASQLGEIIQKYQEFQEDPNPFFCMTPDANGLCVFAVRRGNIQARFDVRNTYYIHSSAEEGLIKVSLGELTVEEPCYGTSASAIKRTGEDQPKYIRITDFDDYGIPEGHEYMTAEEYSIKHLLQPGDILFARTGGTVGKTYYYDGSIGNAVFAGYCIRFRFDESKVLPKFVYWYTKTDEYVSWVKGIQRPSGQPNINKEEYKSFRITLPDLATQKKLVEILEEKLQARNQKLLKAERMIDAFETDLESRLDLSSECKNKLYYAIRLSQLDGVIDAKRYMSVKKENETALSEYCEIIDEKENVSIYGDQTIDWIRIDDLPNNPVEIKTVRTVTASTMEGSFFKVQSGDILVARLGPTILNQKVVMVRNTDRTTLASAEFLVLRCNSGCDPEAVMAVIKTHYYRDMMYSHARGSTPSRYRLNREDALTLPFPDIRADQSSIAVRASTVRNEVIQLRKEAEQEWHAAKQQFERELLGE